MAVAPIHKQRLRRYKSWLLAFALIRTLRQAFSSGCSESCLAERGCLSAHAQQQRDCVIVKGSGSETSTSGLYRFRQADRSAVACKAYLLWTIAIRANARGRSGLFVVINSSMVQAATLI